MNTPHPASTSRRQLLKGILAAGTAPYFIPASALGRDGRPAPSERITLGCIGFGTITHYTVPSFLKDERVQIVAIADPVKDFGTYGYTGELRGGREVGKAMVEKAYAEKAPSGGFKGCDAVEDFRELINRADIDALNISTPDHWHAIISIMAAKKGKHIYGQKPLALTVGEGRAMCEAVKQAGVTWQTGSQQRSDLYMRTACEFIRNNRLGKLQAIKVALPGGHNSWAPQPRVNKAVAVPEGINWDLWQGPAPVRDFNMALFPLTWRHNYDYSGGMVTDFGAHHIDIVHWALGMDESGPVEFENIKAELPNKDELWNTATKFSFDAVYADGNRMSVFDVADFKASGITFVGEGDKTLFTSRGVMTTTPKELRGEKIKEGEVKLYESRDHEKNFIDCIYSGKPTVAPLEAAHRTITVAHLANLAIRNGVTKFKWDPKTEKSDNDTINAGLSRAMRAPWSLETV
jgi:predicted dehydrogenase